MRLLIALDTGGAVTDSHLDWYAGTGHRAGIEAGHYRHFGRVWKLSDQPLSEKQESLKQKSEDL